jgi:hypothetical protein
MEMISMQRPQDTMDRLNCAWLKPTPNWTLPDTNTLGPDDVLREVASKDWDLQKPTCSKKEL